MYSNIGEKMKTTALICASVLILTSVIYGLTLTTATPGIGLLVIVTGCFVGWMSGMGMYAFGQMVEDLGAIRNKLYEHPAVVSVNPTGTDETAYSDSPCRKEGKTPIKQTWTCSCGAKNSLSVDYCQVCRKKGPYAGKKLPYAWKKDYIGREKPPVV